MATWRQPARSRALAESTGRKEVRSLWMGGLLSSMALAVLVAPVIIFQYRHFRLGWHDVGTYTRVIWNFLDHGRFALYSNGTGDFFVDQHFEPFLFALILPVRLFDTAGYVTTITAALAVSAGYVFALAATVTRSRWIAALIAAAYVVNPYTHAIALSYHVETFAVLFIVAFAYYSHAGRNALAWTALILALLVKEDMWMYVSVTAVLVARPRRWRQTAAFVSTALAYYGLVIVGLGNWLYPTANYLSVFYKVNDHPLTRIQIAETYLARWPEFVGLLFTGPGLAFQLSLVFATALAGWRYLLICGVLLIWLSYPDGPPRSNLAFYYSYSMLALSFVALPFAMTNLRTWSDLAARTARFRAGSFAVSAVMSAMLATDVVMHIRGYAPSAIEPTIDDRSVFGRGAGVDADVVRPLIWRYLPADAGGVLAEFYTIQMIPQRHVMYVTYAHRAQFISGHIRPRFVLLDLGSVDPEVTIAERQTMADMLRHSEHYEALYDDQGVLLYRRREP